ncbi:MAG: Gfo/Idh/MocA family oxidoreductase [Bacteroidales bacterium]|nr:Gfo/Idh/MocA family oxidoreductase [Bacteroidales bacterium]
MSDVIKIGVLGCANIARNFVIPAIKCLPEKFELVAVSSRSADKAKTLASEFHCHAVEGYEKMIDSDEIDALYIPLPTGLHKEWINKALLAGKHVYAEKSIASDFTQAAEMVDHARQHNLALMEGFMFQYHSQHEIVFNLIKNGEIGEIRFFSASFGFPPLAKGNFRYDEHLGGGALMDAGGYPVRATHFILGNDFEVKGATLFIDPELKTNTYGSAFLTNSKGTGASVSFGFDNFYQCRYEIWGEKGKITAERAFTPKPDYKPKIIVEKPESTKVIEAEPDNHFIKSFEEFYRIICGSSDKNKHYSDILLQSKTLEQIKILSCQP